MSFLSSFGGANPYKLVDYAGNQNAFTNTYLRDFTAYNDNFMLIFPNNGSGDNVQGGLWVGNRLNSLHRVSLNSQAYSKGGNINGCGGDPMVAKAAGFSEYGSTSLEYSYLNTSLTNYEYPNTNSDNTAPSYHYGINVASVNTNTSSNTQDWSRYVYHQPSGTLYVFKKTNTSLFIRRIDSTNYRYYTPTITGDTTQWVDNGSFNSGYFSGVWCTMPEINPVNGDIMCYVQAASNAAYLISGGGSNTLNVTSVATASWTSATSTRYVLAVKNANEFAFASEEIDSTYSRVYYTTDGGTTFNDTGDPTVNGKYYKSIGYANGYFYSIYSIDTPTYNSSWNGNVSRSTDFGSWNDIFDTPVTNMSMIRSNGLGTSCYVGGGHYSTVAYNSQPQIHRIA